MIDVSPVMILVIMGVASVVIILSGLPFAFGLGGVAVVCIIFLWDANCLPLVAGTLMTATDMYLLVAVPFFVFMSMVLQGSGVAEDLFNSIRLWFGGGPGGLAIAVIFTCTIVAAMTGLVATGIVLMGIMALPIMLRLKYDKGLAIAPIMVGGSLGVIIPPSVSFLFYASITRTSIGRLFAGGVVPGFMLSALYIAYIGIRCYFNPELGPPLPPEERVSFKEKVLSLKSLVLPAMIVFICLGTIILGICSATEAAAAAAIASVICAAIHRRLNWALIKEACYVSLKIGAMVIWITVGAFCFKAVFIGLGGTEVAGDFIAGLEVDPIIVILIMQLSYMFMGCFMDCWAQLMITLPVYLPIAMSFGYSPIWFGILFFVNSTMADITPPYGFSLFYMRGVAPPEITMGDIYRSILPFLPLQLIVVLLLVFFPQLVLWLPNLVFALK